MLRLAAGEDNVSSLGDHNTAQPFEDPHNATTASRLRLDLSFIGRSTESDILNESFHRIRQPDGKSEVVVVGGSSGTGKSSLIESLRDRVTLEANGFWVSGKFDQLRNEPFSALVAAFSDLCDLVSQEYGPEQIKSTLKELETDYKVLANLIPSLQIMHSTFLASEDEQDLATVTSLEAVSESMASTSGKDMFARIKFSCRRFLNTLSSSDHPVLLFLDDLQWADEASIKLIQSLITDQSSKNVLIVCAYRIDDEELSEAMVDFLELIDQEDEPNQTSYLEGSSFPLDVRKIFLGDFDLEAVDHLLTSLLQVRNEGTSQLSELIMRRTHGNPYFVMEFVQLLESSGLILWSDEQESWDWDLSTIQTETSACENVGEILMRRVQRLPQDAQSVLKIAACLGYRFECSLLRKVALDVSPPADQSFQQEQDRTIRALQMAEEMGLVEEDRQSSDIFFFSHDRVHQCLYTLIPEGDIRSYVHLGIAKSFVAMSTPETREMMVCAIADQLNRATAVFQESDRLDAIRANLDAARVAVRKSAIPLAAEYVDQGVAMLVESDWEENYCLALDMYTTMAQVSFCSGRFIECRQSVGEVELHAKKLEDSVPARSTLVSALGCKGELSEAVEVAFDLARGLGVDIPKKPRMRHVIIEMIKTKALLKTKTDDDLLEQSLDYDDGGLYRILGQAAQFSSIGFKIPHLCVAVLKLTQISVSKSNASSPVFASYGMLESVLGNYDEAYRFGQLALKLQEIQGNIGLIPHAYPLVYTFFHHWRHPLRECLEPLNYAYEVGMTTGEVDGGFIAIQAHLSLAFHCGLPLRDVEAAFRLYCNQMADFDHYSETTLVQPLWQCCLNLLDQSDDPLVLTGEAMNEERHHFEAAKSGHHMAIFSSGLARIILCCFLDNSTGLEELVSGLRESTRIRSHFNLYISLFYTALSTIAMARTSNERWALRKARKCYSLLVKYVEKAGCSNCIPLASFVKAELADLTWRRQKQNTILELYDQAIADATDQGLVHVQAMATEKAGEHLLRKSKQANTSSASPSISSPSGATYLQNAWRLFYDWGAIAKANQMRQKHPELLARVKDRDLDLPSAVTTITPQSDEPLTEPDE